MPGFPSKILIATLIGTTISFTATAQDTVFNAKHAAISFPYPMYTEKWRSSIGFTLMTTPEDITEELRLRIPCGDFQVLRRINNQFNLEGRVMFQVLQNHVSLGVRYVKPITDQIYFAAGDDIGYWLGILKIDGFNSRGRGILNYSHLSLGYKTRRNLLISFRAQVSLNLDYKAVNGESTFTSKKNFYNGETFTLALEQLFFNDKHLTLAISTINNYFYWQTWSLFYKTNRKVFYPQITVALIL
ncbi:MAG: hypothetical protein V4722_13685 [Bacteroidota bacterium]